MSRFTLRRWLTRTVLGLVMLIAAAALGAGVAAGVSVRP